MIMDLNYNDKDFKEKIINLPKGVKGINLNGENININLLCNILEDVKENVFVNCKYNKEINEEFKRRNTYQGFNRSILNMVKKICEEHVNNNDYVVDMTVGNGNDTLFLTKISKKVFGFDVQKIAIDNTTKLLKENNANNYELFNISHDNIDEVLNKYKHSIKLILFNLGYLPCGDKSITTMHETTLRAVRKSIDMINNEGLILIVFYPHDEGKKEASTVIDYLDKNNINYKIYKNTPNKEAPYLVVIS